MPEFRAGDAVHVAGFGTGIVREARNAGRYLVEVKGRPMEVREALLTAVESKKRQRPRPDPASPPQPEPVAAGRGAPSQLDLHGKTVEEALQALDTFLNEALLAGAAEVLVIHGRSGGRLRSAVHRRLGELPPVRAFRLDPRNPGATLVTF